MGQRKVSVSVCMCVSLCVGLSSEEADLIGGHWPHYGRKHSSLSVRLLSVTLSLSVKPLRSIGKLSGCISSHSQKRSGSFLFMGACVRRKGERRGEEMPHI